MKPCVARTVRTPIYFPVVVIVAYLTLGYVSPPVLYFTCIAKSATALAQPRSNITGHNM